VVVTNVLLYSRRLWCAQSVCETKDRSFEIYIYCERWWRVPGVVFVGCENPRFGGRLAL
jgi:hypothetical protein